MRVPPGPAWRALAILPAGLLALAVAVAGPATARSEPPPPPSSDNASSVSDNTSSPLAPAVTAPTDNAAPAPAVPAPMDNVSPAPLPAERSLSERIVEGTASGVVSAVDRTHARLEESILDRVIRFDNFFGNVKTEDLRKPDYLIRWVNSLRVEERGGAKYRTTARASLVLPQLSKRLRLVIAGETEPEPFTARLPEDPGNPGFDRTLANTRLANTELRYMVVQKPLTEWFLGAGVRITLPFETFVRTRYQYTLKIGEATLARFAETVFWKNTTEFGETTEIELARKFGPKHLLRWANAATWTEEAQGLEWATELSLQRELTPRSAITFGGGLSGHTRPISVVDVYRVFTRYRRNFLRSWLFYELEPEVLWPRNEAGEYPLTYAFTFRLELVFQGTPAMSKKPPGAP